jgi:nucleotide-binding universal stress UspA family protein
MPRSKEEPMHAPSKILVPVDFSASSRAALEYASVLAACLGAEVDVLHVWRPQTVPTSRVDLLADFARSDPGHTMMEWLGALDRPDVEAHGRLAAADRAAVPDTILDVAESGEYDLVVIGATPHGRLAHLFKASVTEQIVERAPCPVITVRAANDVHPEPPASADPDIMTMWSWPS